jgi:two-component system response regulator FixJ
MNSLDRSVGKKLCHVYIVDDDAMVRRSLTLSLRSAGFVPRPFNSGRDFIEAVSTLPPGCVLLDLQMPEMDGFQVLEEVRPFLERFPIVVITGHGDVALAVRAMKLGARDFVEKPFVDSGLFEILEHLSETVPDSMKPAGPRSDAIRRLRLVTAREMDVLRGVVAGMPNKRIADRLGLSIRTVEMHRGNLMSRLGVSSLAELLRFAFEAGIEPFPPEA